jgi:hypothetical protein
MVLEATRAHATELINSGVSIEAVRRRPGQYTRPSRASCDRRRTS